MRVAMTGASGMVGTALTRSLSSDGWQVVPISRRPAPGAIVWNAADGPLDPALVSGFDAVINLAGENLAGGRWTTARKAKLRSSRLATTSELCAAMTAAAVVPPVLISVSAVGFYGNRGDEVLDEASDPGDDFLAQLCIDWEAACIPAANAGVRVVHPRFGVILSHHGGALDQMLPFFRMGAGGPYGTGQQWMPWIALDDVVRGIVFVIENPAFIGPVNFVAPHCVRNDEFAHTLGAVLHRPSFIPAPAFAMRLALGELADTALLASQHVSNTRLKQTGFNFEWPELRAALEHVLQ